MKCIQCEKPASNCAVIREINFHGQKSILCKNCATCYRCNKFLSQLRPSTQLKYIGRTDAYIVETPVNYMQTRTQVVCESAPWKCMQCDVTFSCRICRKGELKKGNCHARCFDIWCVWRIRKISISMLPKDVMLYIIRNFDL